MYLLLCLRNKTFQDQWKPSCIPPQSHFLPSSQEGITGYCGILCFKYFNIYKDVIQWYPYKCSTTGSPRREGEN